MLFKFPVSALVVVCLFIVFQLGSDNHYYEAEFVVKAVTITTAVLLCLRVFWKNQRKIGWRSSFLALIPLSIYVLFNFVLNNTGGLGAE